VNCQTLKKIVIKFLVVFYFDTATTAFDHSFQTACCWCLSLLLLITFSVLSSHKKHNSFGSDTTNKREKGKEKKEG